MILFSCDNHRNRTDSNNQKQGSLKIKVSDAEFAEFDSKLISQYKDRLIKADAHETKFVNNLLGLLDKFKSKKLDTTILTTGYIDEDSMIDTIQTRVFLKQGSIHVFSSWIKNLDTLWQFQIQDPYFYISNSDLFINNRSEWIIFTIGIYYSIPAISKFKDYKNLMEMSIDIGIQDLKKQGFNINSDEYKKYILNFNGNLLCWGDQRYREGLHIWYKPLKRFVNYYQP
jgi:hypothetical protein